MSSECSGASGWDLLRVRGQSEGGIGTALADTADVGRLVTLEDRAVFGEGQRAGCFLDRVPVGVLRTAFDVVDVDPVDGERNPQPHQ